MSIVNRRRFIVALPALVAAACATTKGGGIAVVQANGGTVLIEKGSGFRLVCGDCGAVANAIIADNETHYAIALETDVKASQVLRQRVPFPFVPRQNLEPPCRVPQLDGISA